MSEHQKITEFPLQVVLTSNQINGLKRDELTKYAIKISNAYQQIYDKLFDVNDGLFIQLQNQLAISQNTNKLSAVERRSICNSQYSRKETIELNDKRKR